MNIIFLSGRLTAVPEINDFGEDGTYINFSVAINNGKDSDGNEREADFVPCVAFNNTANYIYNYSKKGGRINIQGRWKSSTYKNKEGEKKYANQCLVERAEIIDFYTEEDENPFINDERGNKNENTRGKRTARKTQPKKNPPKRRGGRN